MSYLHYVVGSYFFHLQRFCSLSKIKDTMGFACILSTGNMLILRTQFNQCDRVFQFERKGAIAWGHVEDNTIMKMLLLNSVDISH